MIRNEDLGRSKLMELKMKAKQYLENEKKNKELSKNKKQKSTIVLLGSTLSKNLLKGPGAEKNAKLGTSEIQKLVEQGKSQERFEDIKKILQDRRSLFEKVSYEIDNLENSEKVLNSCLSYYEQRFGAGIEEPTTLIKKSEEYEQVIETQKILINRLIRWRWLKQPNYLMSNQLSLIYFGY